MFGLGFNELLIVGVVAVVLFGKRLPDVAKSLGASYREFRQGLSEIQSQMDFTGSSYSSRRTYRSYTDPTRVEESENYDEPTAPKFELPAPADPGTGDTAAESPAN